jgi:hypothetical protein
MRGLEPLTSCMRSNYPELPNLLKLWEAIEITDLPFSLSFQILAGFCISLSHFLTQIHTQKSAFKEERNKRSVSGHLGWQDVRFIGLKGVIEGYLGICRRIFDPGNFISDRLL